MARVATLTEGELQEMGVKRGHIKSISPAIQCLREALKQERQAQNDAAELCCPISMNPFKDDAVRAADGNVYSRDAISTWLVSHNRSPLTNLELQNKDLVKVKRVGAEWVAV